MSSEDNSFEELEYPFNKSSGDHKDSANKSATKQNEANGNAINENTTDENANNQIEVNKPSSSS